MSLCNEAEALRKINNLEREKYYIKAKELQGKEDIERLAEIDQEIKRYNKIIGK